MNHVPFNPSFLTSGDRHFVDQVLDSDWLLVILTMEYETRTGVSLQMGIKIFFHDPDHRHRSLATFRFHVYDLAVYNRPPDVQYLVFSIVVFPTQTLNLFLPHTRTSPN